MKDYHLGAFLDFQANLKHEIETYEPVSIISVF